VKVFVAGATGALGKQLVPMLVAQGHEVVGMTRTEAKRDQLRSLGAQPVVADALDADAVGRAVRLAEPDVIVHQLTAIPPSVNMRRFDREFALTNRLRIEGTGHLLSAGKTAGVKRFVAQSNAGVLYARTGGPIKREDDPLDDDPPPAMRQVLAAIRHLEAAVTGAHWTEGLVLRYGWFYGPGTSIALDPPGSQIELLRKRRFPIVGDGTGVWSFIPSRTPPRQPSPPSKGDLRASTTSSTTNRRGRPSSCQSWRPAWVRSVRFGCPAGSGASQRARWP
jgi:nucleoside-diphosphate-sugar epimerase